jgi:hypothetical protein
MVNLVNVSIDPTNLKTLRVLDKVVGDYLERRLTVSEQSNLRSHLEAASLEVAIEVNLDEATLSEVAAFIDWIDGAKAIDPETFPKASKKWQEALKSLMAGSRDMLNALQKITPDTIESFERNGFISPEDAIDLEKLGLGSVMPVRQNSLRASEAEQKKVLFKSVAYLGVYIVGPLIAFWLASGLFSFTDKMMTNGFIVTMFIGFAFAFYGIIRPTAFWARPFTITTAKFWISDKGMYVLNQAFGGNPNGTVLWPVGPIDDHAEGRLTKHIDSTPNVKRDMSLY